MPYSKITAREFETPERREKVLLPDLDEVFQHEVVEDFVAFFRRIQRVDVLAHVGDVEGFRHRVSGCDGSQSVSYFLLEVVGEPFGVHFPHDTNRTDVKRYGSADSTPFFISLS